MDIASIASVMMTNPERSTIILESILVKNPGIPTILIPTTAGTGAEVTPNAILTDTKEKLKKAIVSPSILPRVAIVDPSSMSPCLPRLLPPVASMLSPMRSNLIPPTMPRSDGSICKRGNDHDRPEFKNRCRQWE